MTTHFSRSPTLFGLLWLIVLAGPLRADVESEIQTLLSRRGVGPRTPGVAILVVGPNGRAIRACRGLAVLDDKTPITPRTTFELASASKPITATAVLILQERGRLSIDDDVRKYIPELPEGVRTARLRDLMQHTSGYPSYLDFGIDRGARSHLNSADFVSAFKDRPFDFASRDKHEYNNTNYMLLAVVIERVSGKSYGAFLREAIFEPCGMKQAGVYERPDFRSNASAVGYTKEDGKFRPTWGSPPRRDETLLAVGDGGIWCSLGDLLGLETAIREGRILDRKSWDLALQPSKTRDGKTNAYGLGWTLYPAPGGGLNGYGHNGSWAGFSTSIYRDLLKNRTTVILSNRSDFDVDECWEALQKVLDRKG